MVDRSDPSVDMEAPAGKAVPAIIALALAPAVGLGIARFAYALLLPDMRADLGWSYADAGWLNTTNALGYLAGALMGARTIGLLGARRAMLAGVLACVLSLALMTALRDPLALNLARILAGVGGGVAFVAGGVLATAVAAGQPARTTLLIGLFYAGPGFGILVSGLIIPFFLAWSGPGSWPAAWGVLCVVALVMLVPTLARRVDTPASAARRAPPPYRRMRFILAGYLVFGAGYISYMTFMIAWVQGNGGAAAAQALFWATIGIGAMISPWIWSGVLQTRTGGSAFALLVMLTTIGAGLPLLSTAVPLLFVSAAVFGCTFFAVVAATTAYVRRNLERQVWPAGIGAMTAAFGIGQMIGPVGIGLLSDLTGSLSSSLWASVVLLVAAALIGSLQGDVGEEG